MKYARVRVLWLAVLGLPLAQACSSTSGAIDPHPANSAGDGDQDAGGVFATGGTAVSAGSGGHIDAMGGAAAGKSGSAGTAAGGRAASGGLAGSAAAPITGGSAGRAGEGGRGGNPSGGTHGNDAGAGGAEAEGGSPTSGEEIPAGYVKGIVAVGYGGIRVVSRDDGQTWSDAVAFGDANADDENLLRAVIYGKGRWIATGWKLLFSDDGVKWTQHSMVHDQMSDQQIIEGLAYANGYFYAAGDPGKLYRSSDGLSWERYGSSIGNTEKHTALSFRGGVFVAYGDSHTSFQSSDGMSWSQISVKDATFCEGQWRSLEQCHDAAWFDGGFYLHAEWGGTIQRSTTGTGFKSVYSDPDEHTAYKSFTFAEGYVKP